MKLVRATCECGFHTQKARDGYHFHKWWFPVLVRETGQIHDVNRSLPDEQVDRIQLSKVKASEIHSPFLDSITRDLLAEYANKDDELFAPAIGDTFRCPNCSNNTLRIVAVLVTAFCNTDCGHEYQWHDSEEPGCPRCNHRPHRFRIEAEDEFTRNDRTFSHCPCSSSMDSASHADAYCPKCGELPVRYHVNNQSYCGIHHTPMAPYSAPSNFLFIEAAARWVSDRFPNAKLWGNSEADDSLPSTYCPTCESDHQVWLATEEAG